VCGKIREEATSHLRTETDWNNPEAFNSLELTNSAVHESLRVRPTMLKGLTREVVPKNGIKVPDGTYAPEGAWMSVPVHAIHMDERLYEDPTRYDPFRFLPAHPPTGKDPQGVKTGVSDQPSATFLTFGFGRYTW
jgi:cytochrome P450